MTVLIYLKYKHDKQTICAPFKHVIIARDCRGFQRVLQTDMRMSQMQDVTHWLVTLPCTLTHTQMFTWLNGGHTDL